MSRSRKHAVVTLLLLSSVAFLLVTARPKGTTLPVVATPRSLRTHRFISHPASAPEVTLPWRLSTLDAVAQIHVLAKPRVRAVDTTQRLRRKFPGVNPARRLVFPVTEWTVRVIDALKPHASVRRGATITIGAFGGRAILEDRELLADPPAFDLLEGEFYLIFLTFDDQLDMFVSSEFDVFNVSGPLVRAAGTRTIETPYGKELAGRASREAISAVRAALLRR